MISIPERSGLISFSLGVVLLLASNVKGHGIGIVPDPKSALLLAAAGLLFFVLADFDRWNGKLLRLLQLVLALGSFSVVATLMVGAFEKFRPRSAHDWGAIPPPQLIFAATYTLASLVTLLVLSIRDRRGASGPRQN
jgi:hypothetical protein